MSTEYYKNTGWLPNLQKEDLLIKKISRNNYNKKKIKLINEILQYKLNSANEILISQIIKENINKKKFNHFKQFNLVVISNNTTHFLKNALEMIGFRNGIYIKILEAGYDQTMQLALNKKNIFNM